VVFIWNSIASLTEGSQPPAPCCHASWSPSSLFWCSGLVRSSRPLHTRGDGTAESEAVHMRAPAGVASHPPHARGAAPLGMSYVFPNFLTSRCVCSALKPWEGAWAPKTSNSHHAVLNWIAHCIGAVERDAVVDLVPVVRAGALLPPAALLTSAKKTRVQMRMYSLAVNSDAMRQRTAKR
jgi:hypothetical protein